MMITLKRDPSSFRDRSGHVYKGDDKVYRAVTSAGLAKYQQVRQTDFIKSLIATGQLIDESPVQDKALLEAVPEAAILLVHPKLPYLAYPYEWPFSLLQAAALFHLQLQQQALQAGVTLSDASAYNIQFQGINPIFIDHLSFIPYQEGEYWVAHQQFCQQFLNPLLLTAHTGVAYQPWYRGNLTGISTETLNDCLPWQKKLSFNMLLHVSLQARLQRTTYHRVSKIKQRHTFAKETYLSLLKRLYRWIATLAPKNIHHSTWYHYDSVHRYEDGTLQQKHRVVKNFIQHYNIKTVVDLGCNTGQFAQLALEHGAEWVIGLDSDRGALHQAVLRAKNADLHFLPLYCDLTNPSPDSGWHNRERLGLQKRCQADGLLALAIVHHLAISHNVPLVYILEWILSMAPHGIIEFVPKQDPMVQRLLQLREDIFDDYHEEYFLSLLKKRARHVACHRLPHSQRILVEYHVDNA